MCRKGDPFLRRAGSSRGQGAAHAPCSRVGPRGEEEDDNGMHALLARAALAHLPARPAPAFDLAQLQAPEPWGCARQAGGREVWLERTSPNHALASIQLTQLGLGWFPAKCGHLPWEKHLLSCPALPPHFQGTVFWGGTAWHVPTAQGRGHEEQGDSGALAVWIASRRLQASPPKLT